MLNGKNDPRIPHTNQRTATCKRLKTNYLVEVVESDYAWVLKTCKLQILRYLPYPENAGIEEITHVSTRGNFEITGAFQRTNLAEPELMRLKTGWMSAMACSRQLKSIFSIAHGQRATCRRMRAERRTLFEKPIAPLQCERVPDCGPSSKTPPPHKSTSGLWIGFRCRMQG